MYAGERACVVSSLLAGHCDEGLLESLVSEQLVELEAMCEAFYPLGVQPGIFLLIFVWMRVQKHYS